MTDRLGLFTALLLRHSILDRIFQGPFPFDLTASCLQTYLQLFHHGVMEELTLKYGGESDSPHAPTRGDFAGEF